MNLLPKNKDKCPFLLLAPMEGVGSRDFRIALASIGGFDEAVRDFLRVPKNAHVKSLAVVYDPLELISIPLAPQLMGSDPDLMAEMAKEMEIRGAHRIDLNCGCPSNTVTGRGAGSSLLKNPEFVYEVASALVKAVSIPITIKMRSGYENTSLFKENLKAAEESKVSYITLHPRTKVDGYGPPAKWDFIKEAKSIVKIPVVGNGDILNVNDALRMLKETQCDALMIGRGAVINPFIFHEIKAHFSKEEYLPQKEQLFTFFEIFMKETDPEIRPKMQVNRVKQLLSFMFKGNNELLKHRNSILTSQYATPEELLHFALPLLSENLKLKT